MHHMQAPYSPYKAAAPPHAIKPINGVCKAERCEVVQRAVGNVRAVRLRGARVSASPGAQSDGLHHQLSGTTRDKRTACSNKA